MIKNLEIKSYLKLKRSAFIVIGLLFALFIFSLIIRNYFFQFYPLAIIFYILIFIFLQYFDLNYRFSIAFALVLIIACPFLIACDQLRIAEYFGNYFYGFLFLGLICIYFDGLRENLKKKNKFNIYRNIFLFLFAGILIFSGFTVFKDMIKSTSFTYIIKNYIQNSFKSLNRNNDYSSIEEVTFYGEEFIKGIKININNPSENSLISGSIQIKGSAIEKNAQTNSGIERTEFFIDGKPGTGTYLGYFEIPVYEANKITIKNIEDKYIGFLKRLPTKYELNYWAINIEYGIISYKDFIDTLFNSKEFANSNLNHKKLVDIVYNNILYRKPDVEGYYFWLDQLDRFGIENQTFLNTIFNTEEFKSIEKNYYNNVNVKTRKLRILEKSIGDNFGKQFYLSGFVFNFDSTKFTDGKHELYVYAKSQVFGWDYNTVKFIIKNK